MLTILALVATGACAFSVRATEADVVVYSGTAGGVIAAVASARSGATTILVHE